ncbi:MAG: DUF1493 family protein [Bosea sp.]|uniref:DUF1493 family protein n=1 Tax=Bosea sp. (in: a-proteobacteria) TaxID=1871050 RepID=UPI00239D8364|nr:DUF1493 family protein [Bosea sp. (in: a-proteobacteria)]MCP4739853.1 DUF1493 family protein [Bosea sp. (in: a-proteobacteria)]
MDFADYLEQIRVAVADFCGERHVTPETSINGGFRSLGIDGDDAVDLLNHLSEEFGTSFERFPYARYFGPESLSLSFLIGQLRARHKGDHEPLGSLTIGDLARFMWEQRLVSDNSSDVR